MALPFVVMLIGLEKAVPLLSTLNLILALFLILRSWKNIQWKEYLFIVLHVGLGVPAGLLLVDHLPQKVLIGTLVLFTLSVGIRGLLTSRTKEKTLPVQKRSRGSLTRFLLFAGGIFQGAFSSGGPLVVIYSAKALPGKSEFRATLPVLWFTTNSLMEIKWILSGTVWDLQLFRQFLWALPFICGGMLLGDFLHHRVNQEKFRILVYSLLVLVAGILGAANFL